ncbi:CPXCG motif-containing cysteine-rich protein [Yeosuana sp. MJ-SS3]|uniref:CPXCG motif-containing cysteine-rich protein n=1 Tax=Gilvirhabdus luticola TaxID=3079858 RepID=A0ABU3U5S4_9FLAO|nr:CPXCG motif-containing cysteine-rich protein [Yeosuana sp. MJ-SS3]MDU8885711.1 CPXCG motif-containing cysteine-rich protein [Yeosuana sp. MJ-SS3]
MIEHFFTCPYCWQNISMLLDSSIRQQSFIEDCEICCNPIELLIEFTNKELSSFEVKAIQ